MKKQPQQPEPAKRQGKPGKAPASSKAMKPRKTSRKKQRAPGGVRKLAISREGHLPRWWKPYMEDLEANGGFKTIAKQNVGISRNTPEHYINDHPELKEQFETEQAEAIERATERILAEGVRRGVKGWEEPVFYKGRRMDVVTKFSDTLLIFSANARGVGTREPAQVRINLDLDEMREMPADLLQRLVAGDNPAEVVAAWRARQEAEKILGDLPKSP